MTPREVDELSGDEYAALWDHLEQDGREQQRAARRAQRKR